MRPDQFSRSQRAFVRPISGDAFAYFPPVAPPTFALSPEVINLLADANHALGDLEGTGRQLANPRLLIGPYLRREAILSSRIEGTETAFTDLVLFEAGETAPASDAREVLNYVEALELGLERLGELPVSLRLVRDLHRKLMEGVRGRDRAPGEFRRMQNVIGQRGVPLEDVTFVPPPAGPAMDAALDDWERFIHRSDEVPLLIRCAWMHYQFETIHPFMDGNGRTGRLLIPLLLIERAVLTQPLLYVSAYLERHRDEYYDALMAGRLRGDLEPWFKVFLRAVATQARDAVATAQRLAQLRAEHHQLFAKSRSAVIRPLIDRLFERLSVTVPDLARDFAVSEPAAQAAVNALVVAGVLRETTGRKRRRVYLAHQIVRAIMPEDEVE